MARWLYAPVDSDEFARTRIDLAVVNVDALVGDVAEMKTRLRPGGAYVTDSESCAHYLAWAAVPRLKESHDETDDGEYEWRAVPGHAVAEVEAAVAAGGGHVDQDEMTLGGTGRVWFTHRPRKSDEEYESPVLEPEDYDPSEAKCES